MKQLARIEKDVDSFRAEREGASVTIAELRRQLDLVTVRAEEAEKKAQSDALGVERRLVAELRDELADERIEKKLVEDRARAEMRDFKEESERQQSRANVVELELRGEVAVRGFHRHFLR